MYYIALEILMCHFDFLLNNIYLIELQSHYSGISAGQPVLLLPRLITTPGPDQQSPLRAQQSVQQTRMRVSK